MSIILRVLAISGGLISLYAAIFLYENEQGKIQSVLEDLWLRIEDRRQAFLSRHAAFMSEVARFTESGFDRLFGHKLLSLQSAAVSACYSLASVCLVLSYIVSTYDNRIRAVRKSLPPDTILANTLFSEEYGDYLPPSLVMMMLWLIALGTIPLLIRKRNTFKLWFAAAVISVLCVASALYLWEYYGWVRYFDGVKELYEHSHYSGRVSKSVGHTSILWENMLFEMSEELLYRRDFAGIMLISYYVGIGLGIASDTVFIAITRKMLRWSSRLESFFRILSIILLNCVLAVALCLGPVLIGAVAALLLTGRTSAFWGSWRYPNDYSFATFSLPLFVQGLHQVGFVAALSNVNSAFFATIFIALALVTLIHRFFWPLIERPVYALQRLGIAKRSKFLGALGLMLVGFGLGVAPAWLKDLVDKLGP